MCKPPTSASVTVTATATATPDMALLEIRDLYAYYGKARALHAVSLSVEAGQIIAIIGPVGAGKSTLVDSVMGLAQTDGRITYDGTDLAQRRPADIVRLGVACATERGNLFPYMGVRENLLVGAFTARRDINSRLRRVFDLFPVLESRQRQETHTQSGGERQMVSLGRALMAEPKLLLVDEPTIGLSPKVCGDIAAALVKLNRDNGLTIVIAEQNVNFAMRIAEKIYLLENGTITKSGSPAELQRDETVKKTYFGG